jgi:predicted ribosome quality control (RQC) complex YloA/Tae2 family protein
MVDGSSSSVGSDEANEHVSLELAEPDDCGSTSTTYREATSFCARKPEEEPSRDTLRRAAAVAAYHSKARNAGTVGVYCTRARHVSKPRGAKMGPCMSRAGRS